MERITRLFDLLEMYSNEYRSKSDAFLYKKGNRWYSYSASDYIRYSELISRGFLSLGINRGANVATIMVNCPEWNFFDMALMQIGAVQVPIYPTVSSDSYRYILREACIEYLIVSNNNIYERVRPVLKDIICLKEVFSIDPVESLRTWSDLVSLGEQYNDYGKLNDIKASIQPDDLATIIYTSGTTGRPKGVMLSHRNFISNFTGCAQIPDFTINDRALSFLPLCHVYERMLNYLYQSFGMSVYYVESIDRFGEYIGEVKPHAFATVPRILEKIYNRIVNRGRKLKWPQRALFFWALRQGHKYELHHKRGWFFDLKILAANLLVFHKWRKALGGNIKLIVCGGASLHPSLARLFWAAKLYVLEGYGLTETSPVIAVYTLKPDGVRFGTVGKILPGVEVQIAPDGEILCKGPTVMLGYFNRPERTREVIDENGWFHTGDIGMFEDGKYLKITDRKKEIFKTSTGKYITPQVIEQNMRESPFIEQIIVIGENRKYVSALIAPNFEYLKNWCEVKRVTFVSKERAIKNRRINRRIREEIDRFNLDLGQTEKIKKFRLVADEWTVESGELSPTMKLRRNFILEKYHSLIEETYRSPEYNYREEGD